MRRTKNRSDSASERRTDADPAVKSSAKAGKAPANAAKADSGRATALDRRRFMGALGAAVPLGIAGSALAAAQGTAPAGVPPQRRTGPRSRPGSGAAAPFEQGSPHLLPQLFRLESDIHDV